MNTLNVKNFGLASGATGASIYLGCFLLMSVLGKDALVKLGNLLFHGVDFSSIMRMNISIGESFLGLIVSFIFWGLVGYVLSLLYNKVK